MNGHNYVMNLLGIKKKKTMNAVWGRRGSSVKLTWLKDTFMPMMRSDVVCTRAYVLYMLVSC